MQFEAITEENESNSDSNKNQKISPVVAKKKTVKIKKVKDDTYNLLLKQLFVKVSNKPEFNQGDIKFNDLFFAHYFS